MGTLKNIGLGYSRKLASLRACCTRVSDLHVRRQLNVTDCDLVYESTFLAAICQFEAILQELLITFVCQRRRSTRRCRPLVTVGSRADFVRIALGERTYFDLLPYGGKAIPLAKRFLRDGRPFTDVEPNDLHILSDGMKIRNAIAHRSGHAMKVFRRDVAGTDSLPLSRCVPGVLLRYSYRARPTQEYQELYFQTFEKVVRFLARR